MKVQNKQRHQFVRAVLFSAAMLVNVWGLSSTTYAQDEEEGFDEPAPAAKPASAPPAERNNAAPARAPKPAEEAAPENAGGQAAEAAKPAPVIKPWQLSVDPLFKGPATKRFLHPADLTARDRQLLENLDYKPSGTRQRLEQIKKLVDDLSKLPPKSEAVITTTLQIARLYEEQAMVFEWMRVVGVVDPKYPDLAQTLKNIRRQQAKRYLDLILNFPKHPNLRQWKFYQVIARLRLGDPSVREEAVTMIKTASPTEARELAAVGLAMDAAAGRLPSAFGTLENIAQNSTDQYESATFKLLIAERYIVENKHQTAIAMLQEVIATCKGIRKGDKEQTPGTILQAAAHLLIMAGLKNAVAVSPEITQTLVNNDLADYARHYLEQFALSTYSKNALAAIKAYGDVLNIGTLSDEMKFKIEARMLDLVLASNEPRTLQLAWERIISRGVQKAVPLESQLMHTMTMVQTRYKAKPDKESAALFVALHDTFTRGFPFYAAREDFPLRILEALYQTQQYPEVVKRSEAGILRFKDKTNRINAFNYNLKARAAVMGLGTEIKLSSGAKLVGEPAIANGYIANADRLRKLVSPPEAEQLQYQTAYVQLLVGPQKTALARYEEAFMKAPRQTLASESASVLFDILMQRKELVEVEKFTRMLMRIQLIPSRDPYKDLPRFLERVVFDIAKQQFEAKQFELSATKFMSFQKEFPISTAAPAAIERAGAAFAQANKPDLSLAAYEMYLKLYPKLPAAKDIRLATAEMCEKSKQYFKAAEHYQMYNTLYPIEGAQKLAALKAAENFRLAVRIPEALTEYEKHLKISQAPAEQVRVLRLIAEIAMKANNMNAALSALERLNKLVKQPDEVIGVNFNLMNVYQKMNRDDAAKKSASTILLIKPTVADGFKMQSKAKFFVARYEIAGLRTRQIMNQKDVKGALQGLLKDYERVKAELLAPCEIPGVDWCALGYYEASKLASDLGKLVGAVEPHSHLDESVINDIKSLVAWNKDKLRSEARSFALQAEEALTSSGQPEQDAVDKIKLYVQQVKSSRHEDTANAIDAELGGGGGPAPAKAGGSAGGADADGEF